MTTSSEGPPEPRGGIEAAALSRNDAYLKEFVEALGLCPYARGCREGGRLARRVLLPPGGEPGSEGFAQAVEEASAAALEIARAPDDRVEVALLVFPALSPALSQGAAGARAFDALCAAVRERLRAAYAGGGPDSSQPGSDAVPPFYCVAFHPDLPEDLADEHRAVGFVRRSPDPTLQLVRRSALQAVRGDQGSRFVDARALSDARLLAVPHAVPVSDRIAADNLATLRRAGPDALRAQLAELRNRR